MKFYAKVIWKNWVTPLFALQLEDDVTYGSFSFGIGPFEFGIQWGSA